MREVACIAVLIAAVIAAAASGYFLARSGQQWLQSKRHKAAISNGEQGFEGGRRSGKPAGAGERIVMYMERLSREISLRRTRQIWPKAFSVGEEVENRLRLAGISGKVCPQAFAEARVRFAIAGLLVGGAVGSVFTFGMAFVLAAAGSVLGFQAPGRALKAKVASRAHETERHLPEMLDVIALGMRSGLSFDASVGIYSDHFDTVLANEMESARRQWVSGLARRDEALRNLASTYDSVIFARVVETIIRSIRYGSSMVSSLESDAAEARGAYQSSREERIAKAPVKMMIPTGVLILPAMLIMVLGPVLLELMGGGL